MSFSVYALVRASWWSAVQRGSAQRLTDSPRASSTKAARTQQNAQRLPSRHDIICFWGETTGSLASPPPDVGSLPAPAATRQSKASLASPDPALGQRTRASRRTDQQALRSPFDLHRPTAHWRLWGAQERLDSPVCAGQLSSHPRPPVCRCTLSPTTAHRNSPLSAPVAPVLHSPPAPLPECLPASVTC